MHDYDVFNGDADGILARHQWRLTHPRPTAQLISGTKRDIALLQQVPTDQASTVSVFDISYDRNHAAASALLVAGVKLTYFDHHSAETLPPAALFRQLTAHIDTRADVCTSLIVDHVLGHRHQGWAIAAAFGDNLHTVAESLCTQTGLSDVKRQVLRDTGEAINYNAYGDRVTDLLFAPQQLVLALAPHLDPFTFYKDENFIETIQRARLDDARRARALPVHHQGRGCRIYLMPAEPWARRVVGDFANRLARATPDVAHAVLVLVDNDDATVSLRAPLNKQLGADQIAAQFGGGGRISAAGIDAFKLLQLPKLIAALEARYG